MDESSLEVIFVIANDYKCLVWCLLMKIFKFKSFTYIRKANDPLLIWLIVIEGKTKFQKN